MQANFIALPSYLSTWSHYYYLFIFFLEQKAEVQTR